MHIVNIYFALHANIQLLSKSSFLLKAPYPVDKAHLHKAQDAVVNGTFYCMRFNTNGAVLRAVEEYGSERVSLCSWGSLGT